MNMIERDVANQPIQPLVILAKRGGEKQGVIGNLTELNHVVNLNAPHEISFRVTKYANGTECVLWDEIRDFKFVYVPAYDKWYEIKVTIDEEDMNPVKTITGTHVPEAELSQLMLYDVEINTEGDIARDDYVVTKFYDENNPKGSLLNRILADKAPHYTIYHVDDSLKNIQRQFTFSGTSIHDALNSIAEEVGCLFIYGEKDSIDDTGLLSRSISAYDLEDYCQDCGERGNFSEGVCTNCGSTNITPGYGNDTGVFISTENLAESITYDSNTDEVKNCFRLEAGDDYMTATVRNMNPNGSQYIWHFSDETKLDMSDELVSKLNQYDEDYDEAKTTTPADVSSSAIQNYNALVRKYSSYVQDLQEIPDPILGYDGLTSAYYNAMVLDDALQTTMAPGSSVVVDTTAAEQAAKLTNQSMSPLGVTDISTISLATANNATIAYAKVYVDTARYRITVLSSSLSNAVWTGVLTVTSYTDDEDTANTSQLTIQLTDDLPEFVEQKIEKAMKQMDTQDIGIVSLFKKELPEFVTELGKYSLDNLELIQSACTACMDIMIEQGLAEPTNTEYNSMYLPYYNKSRAIESEVILREAELGRTKTLLDEIGKARIEIQKSLDIAYYLGDELWTELCSFRRDDTYSNSNYISDGFSNDEVIANAREFFKAATKEILKASTLQHTITGNLYDVFMLPEDMTVDTDGTTLTIGEKYFKVGDWLRLQVDDKVYKLRLISYSLRYDDLNMIDVEFSDVTKAGGIVSDVKSILDSARSIATSYSYTQRQAEKGNLANATVQQIASTGLDLTNNKIVNSANNQNLVIDSNGMLMRRQNDFDEEYSLEQTKMINAGLYYTDDGWRTAKAGIGRFVYIDPTTGQQQTGYGVIADTIVGGLVLADAVKIYNSAGELIADGDGFSLTAPLSNGETFEDYISEIAIEDLTQEEVFNALTNGERDQGLWLNNGKLYINMEYFQSGVMNIKTPGNVSTLYVNADTGEVRVNASHFTLTTGATLQDVADDATDAKATAESVEARADAGEFSPVMVQIDSSAGNIFKNRGISTILTVTVFRGSVDVTSEVESFTWTKRDKDGVIDPTWTRTMSGNTIQISDADVSSKAIFECTVAFPEE